MSAKKMGLVLLITLVLIIAFQNLKPVPFQILFWQVQIPLIWILLTPFVLGIVTGWIVTLYRNRSRKPADTAPASPTSSES
ncbi:MAG: LapA family protein [Calditrichaeota bacterium]|nr:LapA family protein [Calditrichota bacterium]